MSQIPRQKSLRAPIVFQFPLPENARRNGQKKECDSRCSRKSLHLTSMLGLSKATQRYGGNSAQDANSVYNIHQARATTFSWGEVMNLSQRFSRRNFLTSLAVTAGS